MFRPLTKRSTKPLQGAVIAVGSSREYIVTGIRELSETMLEAFADAVRSKTASRDYYVIEVREGLRKPIKGERLYKWHVGEGLAHKDGWWVSAGE